MIIKSLTKAAHAVILPAFDTTTLSDSVKRFLENGGCSILLGESRKEYVARKVSDDRKSTETAETFLRVTKMD
jgi:beta-N-acetylhexosaminidase